MAKLTREDREFVDEFLDMQMFERTMTDLLRFVRLTRNFPRAMLTIKQKILTAGGGVVDTSCAKWWKAERVRHLYEALEFLEWPTEHRPSPARPTATGTQQAKGY